MVVLSEQELGAVLARLDVRADEIRVLLLLPLIEVAWANGKLHRKERRAIEAFAREHDLLPVRLRPVLDEWLRTAPEPQVLEEASAALYALAQASTGLGESIPPETTDVVMGLCVDVALSAGGFLGLNRIDAAELTALREVAARLHVAVDLDG